MLSTSPSMPQSLDNMANVSHVSCNEWPVLGAKTAPFKESNEWPALGTKSAPRKKVALQNRALLKGKMLQLEEDSTDIGSAMSSDNDVPNTSSFSSPSCTDNEEATIDKGDKDGRLKQAPFLKLKKRGSFQGTPLEPISGTPAGMSEHPPLMFPSPECDSPLPAPKPEDFRAPPGLASPQRARKPKTPGLLATSPAKVSSPKRSRKAKGVTAQSLLATTPPQQPKGAAAQAVLSTMPDASQSHVLPASPNRRARLAMIERAKRDAAPLKVQMESDASLPLKRGLDPSQPVKKMPIYGYPAADLTGSLKTGEPVKKCVTPWLLAVPARVFPAAPR